MPRPCNNLFYVVAVIVIVYTITLITPKKLQKRRLLVLASSHDGIGMRTRDLPVLAHLASAQSRQFVSPHLFRYSKPWHSNETCYGLHPGSIQASFIYDTNPSLFNTVPSAGIIASPMICPNDKNNKHEKTQQWGIRCRDVLLDKHITEGNVVVHAYIQFLNAPAWVNPPIESGGNIRRVYFNYTYEHSMEEFIAGFSFLKHIDIIVIHNYMFRRKSNLPYPILSPTRNVQHKARLFLNTLNFPTGWSAIHVRTIKLFSASHLEACDMWMNDIVKMVNPTYVATDVVTKHHWNTWDLIEYTEKTKGISTSYVDAMDYAILSMAPTLYYVDLRPPQNRPDGHPWCAMAQCLTKARGTSSAYMNMIIPTRKDKRNINIVNTSVFCSNVFYVSFAAGGYSGRKRMAITNAMESGYFFNGRVLGYLDLPLTFRESHSPIVPSSDRGYGYMAWKPAVILEAFKTVEDGRYIFYADVGCTFNVLTQEATDRFRWYKEQARQSSTHVYPVGRLSHLEYKFSKNKTIAAMGMLGHEGLKTGQIVSGIFMIYVSPASKAFVSEWLYWCQFGNYSLVSSLVGHEVPDFKSHRHDQSILSLLLKNRSGAILPSSDDTWPVNRTQFPVWATRLGRHSS